MLDVIPAPSFLPGTQLSGEFYAKVVRPVLDGRSHGAALLGWGSDVLGYDTDRSTDHGWGRVFSCSWRTRSRSRKSES
ncbi:MAG: hypothetical protein ACRDRY_13940 [Pseudonocardiaceae bacterium]